MDVQLQPRPGEPLRAVVDLQLPSLLEIASAADFVANKLVEAEQVRRYEKTLLALCTRIMLVACRFVWSPGDPESDVSDLILNGSAAA